MSLLAVQLLSSYKVLKIVIVYNYSHYMLCALEVVSLYSETLYNRY